MKPRHFSSPAVIPDVQKNTYELESKLPKRGSTGDTIGVLNRDTRNLDYSSYGSPKSPSGVQLPPSIQSTKACRIPQSSS